MDRSVALGGDQHVPDRQTGLLYQFIAASRASATSSEDQKRSKSARDSQTVVWTKWRWSSSERVSVNEVAPNERARSSAGIQTSYQRSARKGLMCQLMTLTSAMRRAHLIDPRRQLGR